MIFIGSQTYGISVSNIYPCTGTSSRHATRGRLRLSSSLLVLLGVTDDFGVPLNNLCFANTLSFINNLSIRKRLNLNNAQSLYKICYYNIHVKCNLIFKDSIKIQSPKFQINGF